MNAVLHIKSTIMASLIVIAPAGSCSDAWAGNPACPAEGSCFEAHVIPGCDNVDCCNAVCAADPFCCEVTWDGGCVNEAAAFCTPSGPPSACEICCAKTPPVSLFGGNPVLLGTDSGDFAASFVLHVFDISGFASQIAAPPIPSWAAPRYEHPMWTQQVLGTVFGVTADGAGNMYLSNCIWYPIHDNGTLGGDEGAVTRIDGVTGNPSLLVNLPQSPLSPPISPGGLGNLTWSCTYQSLYVTNFADGRIYRIDPSALPGQRIKSAWDFATDALDLSGNPEVGDPPGPVGYGERVWGIAVGNDKLFVSQWNRDYNNLGNGQNNKIWSVDLGPMGDPVPGSKVTEIVLAGLPKSAVSDLAFDANCCLYAAQKTIHLQPLDLNCSGAHESNLLKFCWEPNLEGSGYQWVEQGSFGVGDAITPYGAGGAQPDSTAGGVGVDNGNGGRVWATGDYLYVDETTSPKVYTYGAAGLAQTGGNSSNYIAIDFDGDVSLEAPAYDKREIGSCEVICGWPCAVISNETVQCKNYAAGIFTWDFDVTNQSTETAYWLQGLNLPGQTPNPIPLNQPAGLAPGATTHVSVTVCMGGLPQSISVMFSLLRVDQSVICGSVEETFYRAKNCPPCELVDIGCTFIEDEPCGTNVINNGCDAPLGAQPSFGLIQCGDIFCGELWADNGQQDTDWFFIDLPDDNGDGEDRLCLTLNSKVPAIMQIYGGSCGDLALLAEADTPCGPETLCICLPAPGKYKVRVFPGCPPCGALLEGFPCPNPPQYTLTATCSGDCPCVTPPDNMKAWWTLDETGGNVANDSVCTTAGCNTNGVWMGTPTPIDGLVGGAIHLDGGSASGGLDYVAVGPNAPSLMKGATDFTVDAWIRWDGPPSCAGPNCVRPIVTATGYMFGIIPSGQTTSAHLAMYLLTGGGGNVTGLAAIKAHEWVHVAATLEQGTLNGSKLYVNGQLLAAVTASVNNPMSTGWLDIGFWASLPFGNPYFNGDIDEVELFKRALSADEINALYLAGGAGKCKGRLKVPGLGTFCSSNMTTLTMNLWNDSPVAQNYQLSFGPSTTLAGCNGPPIGNFTFMVLPPHDTPTITVAGNTCESIKVKITAPTGAGGLGCGKVSCYTMCATNTAMGKTVCSEGKLKRDCGMWCWVEIVNENENEGVGLAEQAFSFEVENLGDLDGELPYQLTVVATDPLDAFPPVSLNGLPPGVPATGILKAAAGQVGQGTFTAQFLEELPFETFDILIEADTDDDGVFELVAMGSLSYVAGDPGIPCPADLDGNGVVDGADLGTVLGAWGTSGPAGDLDGNGQVNGGDLGLLLGAWGSCL